MKPYGFTVFIKRYGMEELMNCLERNEKNGIVYHREGIWAITMILMMWKL